MNATLTKSLKSGTKTIFGKVIQRGLGKITLVITDSNGSRNIKSFKESDYTVRCY